MKKTRSILRCVTVCSLAALLISPALAAEQEITWNDVFCFSPADFSAEYSTEAGGILLTGVPDPAMGQLMLGNRRLAAGDALTAQQVNGMTFVPTGSLEGDAVISCIGHGADGRLTESEMTLKIGSDKNEAPVAEDSEFTTYKNIPGTVSLSVSDPEGDPLTVTIVKGPKRGDIAVAKDGTVTYTPEKNKVGKDAFTYTVTDSAGNTSEEATVRIIIEKPSDKQTYGDLQDHPALLAATWLREKGIYSGETVSGQLLFQPDKPLSRGEFIAMCVGLTGLNEDAEPLRTGFADEASTPQWLSPYVSTALRCGYISGIPTEQGLVFMADDSITQAQAAKIVSSLLALPETNSETVMAEDAPAIPAWASGAARALSEAELYTVSDANAPLTRGDAAMLLYDVWQAAEKNAGESSLLAWAKE